MESIPDLLTRALLWLPRRWQRVQRDLPALERILVLAPHMDDEIIGCTGLLHRHSLRGRHSCCVYLTDGAAGLKGSERDARFALRCEESRKAADLVGIQRLVFLGRPDGALRPDPALQERLLQIVEEEKPDCILLPYPLDRHPDHRAAFAILETLLPYWRDRWPAILFYQIRSRLPWQAIQSVLDISPEWACKRSALACFPSQPQAIFDETLCLARHQRLLLDPRAEAGELYGHLCVANLAKYQRALACFNATSPRTEPAPVRGSWRWPGRLLAGVVRGRIDWRDALLCRY